MVAILFRGKWVNWWCNMTWMNWFIIGSSYGLLPVWHQAINWTQCWPLSIEPLGTNFNKILPKMQQLSFKKIHFKMFSAKCWQFCCDTVSQSNCGGYPQELLWWEICCHWWHQRLLWHSVLPVMMTKLASWQLLFSVDLHVFQLLGRPPVDGSRSHLWPSLSIDPGPVFCLLLGVSSGCARPITGQVTSVTWPVIGWA